MLAVVVGVLALEGAGLAIADARAVGVRGEDWTGVLLLRLDSSCSVWLPFYSGARGSPAGSVVSAAPRSSSAHFSVAYWLVVPIASAILATHRPRAAVAPADLGRPYKR